MYQPLLIYRIVEIYLRNLPSIQYDKVKESLVPLIELLLSK
jgi:hypothetical protein